MYKMCHGYLHVDGNWEEYLISNNERRTRGSHQFKFRIPKATKNIFKSSFSPKTISEWYQLPAETVTAKSVDFLKIVCFNLNVFTLFIYIIFIIVVGVMS